MQTKSGTNQVAGEAYGYAQDAQWNEKREFEKLAATVVKDAATRVRRLTETQLTT